MITRFHNCSLLRNHQVIKEDLWISDNIIIAPQPPHIQPDKNIDVQGMLLAPGYIDLQINGAFGIDLTSQPQYLNEITQKLPKYGVTAFLPTVVSSSPDQYRKILPLLQPKQMDRCSSVLGIHLEGPFFNPLYAGAHSKEMLRDCEEGLKSALNCYGSLEGVKIITLAPELSGALSLIEALCSLNIVPSAGHSTISYFNMKNAVNAGLKSVTHLFNSMAPFHHREPNLIGTVLTYGESLGISYSLIADNAHLHSAAIQLAWKTYPKGCFLITDGSAGMGLKEGIYHLGGKEIEVGCDAVYVQGSLTLAGSGVTMDAAVRNFKKITNCSLVEAIEAASLKPASLLGIEKLKGTLNIGADADIIILDSDLNVQNCYINGNLC